MVLNLKTVFAVQYSPLPLAGDDDDDDDGFFFVVWLTDERRLASFPAETIVRDPHHRESPTRREQDLNLRRT